MAETKTAEEKLAELDEQIEKIKARKKAILSKQKKDERKARTKRLITIGAEVEHYADCKITDIDSFKIFLAAHRQEIAETQNQKIITDIVSEKKSKSMSDFDISSFLNSQINH